VVELIENLLNNLVFIFERLTWLSIVDILLVALVFLSFLLLLRGTQAMTVLRGALFIAVLVGLLNSFDVLPAFSWLMRVTLPAMLLVIPVIFAPEIRHALERLGRAGTPTLRDKNSSQTKDTISDVVAATVRLAQRQHGALIVLQRRDSLQAYIQTGVKLDALVSPELLLQVFYPNTPLHDGAVIIIGNKLVAAACVLPLSASGILASTPERQMGLRHRAALGISEVSDAVAIVISEETGFISTVQAGRMIRRLDKDRLESNLRALFKPAPTRGIWSSFSQLFSGKERPDDYSKGK